MHLIALRLALAGCTAHSPTATTHSFRRRLMQKLHRGRVALVRLQILRPTRFRFEPGSNPISTTVTILNKILFGLLKFYFTLNTGRKTTSYTFFQLSTWYHFVAVTWSSYIPCTKDSRN